ncbi:MAG: hypothetical protein ACOC8E_03840 [Planctomycetota bacterium]
MFRRIAVALVALGLTGCGALAPDTDDEAGPVRRTLLIDHASGTTSRAHCTVVADPFGDGGNVIEGERLEDGRHKTSFFNDNGFFVVPDEWDGVVVARLAVRGSRKLRIALVSETGKLKSYYVDAPGAGRWCELRLPLPHVAGRIRVGEKIVDVSIWQLAQGRPGGLFVDRIWLVRPAAGSSGTAR